jgi:hypothetical protein
MTLVSLFNGFCEPSFSTKWPGWTFGSYRVFDLAAEDSYLADMLPWSATFTGHLDGAEAIYNGARGNLVGVRIRLGNTPQHGVLFCREATALIWKDLGVLVLGFLTAVDV